MKWKIFIFILFLVLLSGCLDLISTRQKQLCLSTTHESQTSIFDCSKTSECFKKVNTAGMNESDKLNYNIKNQILMYKNNISSAIFYFNNSKENIKKINEFCNGEKDIDIIKNINTLTFNLSKTFEYQDKSWQKSIELLKDYAIFLKENGVENISEEQIYDSYVLINQNLNELRGEEQISENYVSLLKIEAKNAQVLAKKFGFTQSYMTEYGFIDLFSYYSEYTENPKKEIKLPLISKSSNHVFAKLSTIENFLKINESLKEADGYNLYVLFDKEFGSNDSLFTKFIILNNEINNNINLVYEKIQEIETTIFENIDIISETKKTTFEISKNKFKDKKIGFGHYLEILKEIESDLIEEETINEEKQEQLKECDIIILEAKKYNNLYFKELIENYENNTLNEKRNICEKIKKALIQKDCLKDYEILINLKIIDAELKKIDEVACIDLLNQINYNLEKDERIILFKKIMKENKTILKELKMFEKNIDEEIQILNLNYELEDLEMPNYKIIINYEENLNKINNINKKINLLYTNKITNTIKNNIEIIFENGNYYLTIENNYKEGDYCFDTELPDIETLDLQLKINKKEICAEIKKGKNQYLINYKNVKTTTTKLIEIEKQNGLYETTVKNTVTGIYDFTNLGVVFLLDNITYVKDNSNKIWYFTEKENKILYYKEILRKTNIETNIINKNPEYLIIETFKQKNLLNEKICGNLGVISECYDCVCIVKENQSLKASFIENSVVKINTCFEPFQEKTFETQLVVNFEKLENEIINTWGIINTLNNCEFEEVQNKIKNKEKEINKYLNKKLNIDEIQKFLKLKKEIEDIEKIYFTLNTFVENINLIIAKLQTEGVNEKEQKEIEALEKLKFKEPLKTYDKITKIYNDIMDRKNTEENVFELDIKNKKSQLLESLKFSGTDNEYLESKINAFSSTDLFEFKEIEEEVNKKIKENAQKIYELLTDVKNINIKKISENISNVDYLYSDVTLKELYEIKYYPSITTQDTERLNKKKDFLQTVSFTQTIVKFENNYQEEEYLKAIKGLDKTTLERIKDIKTENELVIKGIEQIEKDSRTEINLLEKTYLKPNTQMKLQIEEIKKDYENNKHLLVIKKIKNIKEPEKEKMKINYQMIVVFFILIIGYLGYFKVNKKQKKISKEEKKQKIIRQY